MTKTTFLVRVDERGNWTRKKYREVTADELDVILDKYSRKIKNTIASNKGAVAMQSCFNSIASGYEYPEGADNTQTPKDCEYVLRLLLTRYDELKRIRTYGSVEQYHLSKANKARELQRRILKDQEVQV